MGVLDSLPSCRLVTSKKEAVSEATHGEAKVGVRSRGSSAPCRSAL